MRPCCKANRKKYCAGFTLTELLITLAIIAIVSAGAVAVGAAILNHNERSAFESECQLLCDTLLSAQENAVTLKSTVTCRMLATTDGRSVLKVTAYEHNKAVTQSLTFDHLKFGNADDGKIEFTSNGTTKKGMTIPLIPKSGDLKYLVVQLVSGRIYLKDTK